MPRPLQPNALRPNALQPAALGANPLEPHCHGPERHDQPARQRVLGWWPTVPIHWKQALAGLMLALATFGTAWAQGSAVGSSVTTPRVQAELLAHAPQGVQVGQPLWLGLRITHQPEWHTYWKNPGDSGLPTELQWTLPPGLDVGEIAWPTPEKFPIGKLANFGFKNTVLLPVPVTVTPAFRPSAVLGAGQLDIRLRATWLVCRIECIPEEGEFRLQVPVQSSTALHQSTFEAAWGSQPQPLNPAGGQVTPVAASGAAPAQMHLRVEGLPASAQGRPLRFFPEQAELIETAAPWKQAWEGSTWTAEVPLSRFRSVSPQQVPIVLALESPASSGAASAWRTELPVQGAWPAVVATAGVSPALEQALARQSAQAAAGPSMGWWAALAGALLGGLILNLMPCVFPVLAIKLLALSQPHSARERQAHGLAFTAGVLLAMLALGAGLMALRAAGEQLGWGFQLQSPAVVATLALLFTLIGLNLAGLFDVGGLVPTAWAGKRLRHPLLDQGLSGVLAVAVASPCTAPFMGAALGLALTLPPAQGLAIFAALGLGMALPYLVVSAVPSLARALPRPGPWMVVFRQAMAFPVLATVVWLLWVLGQQSGIDGAAALLLLLLLLAALLWSLGLAGRSRWFLAGGAGLVLAAALLGLGPRVVAPLPNDPALAASPDAPAAGLGAAAVAAGGWRPWSAAAVAQELQAGRRVFVDFTAAWCVTCQVNKQTTLTDAALLDDFAQGGVTLMRADWTRRDPAISAALAQLGRSGVPVYVIYAPGQSPVLLSELISVADVRAALERTR